MQAYFWALADEPADAIQAAVRQWIKTEKWFPKPSELIVLANEIAENEMRTGHRALPQPAETEPLAERIARAARIIAKMDSMRIHNKHSHKTVIGLNAEAEAAGIRGIDIGSLPQWLQDNIATYQEQAA